MMTVPIRRAGRRPAWGRLSLIALLLLGLAAAWRYTPLANFITAERITDYGNSVRGTPWAPYAIVAGYTAAAVTLFPRPLLTLLAVIAFGAWTGVALAAAGIMLAAVLTYYAGRVVPYEKLRRLAGEKLDSVSRVLRQHGIMAIFALNQTPAPPFAVQGLVAGSCRVNLWHYIAGSALGMAPSLLAWTVFGSQVAGALENKSGVTWWIVIAAAVLLVATTLIVRRWFAATQARVAEGSG